MRQGFDRASTYSGGCRVDGVGDVAKQLREARAVTLCMSEEAPLLVSRPVFSLTCIALNSSKLFPGWWAPDSAGTSDMSAFGSQPSPKLSHAASSMAVLAIPVLSLVRSNGHFLFALVALLADNKYLEAFT